MSPNDIERPFHGSIAWGRRWQRRRLEELDRDLAIPDRAMDRAARGLQTLGVESLDLFVGLVHRAGATDFLVRLAAEFEGRFGEADLLAFRLRRCAHDFARWMGMGPSSGRWIRKCRYIQAFSWRESVRFDLSKCH